MRKKCIAVLSAVAGIALALLTLASYIHYETNLPIVSTVSPEKVYEEGTDDEDEEGNKKLPELNQGDNVKLKELLGHTPVEVIAGALLGIIIAIIRYV